MHVSSRSDRWIILLLLLAWAAQPVAAQARGAAASDDSLVVVLHESPPFVMKSAAGEWRGLSISLLEFIAADLGRPMRFIESSSIEGVIEAVARDDADLGAAALTITLDREEAVDFTYPFHMAGLGIAVPASASSWTAVARRFISPSFLRVVAIWVGILLLVGFLVWLFEHEPNPEFGETGAVQGILEGFWFSAVTMTTVGYGDKAPRTLGGRIVTLVWMFAALVMISSLTAAIASTLTLGAMAGSIQAPEDLPGHQIGTVPGSTSADYLDSRRIASTEFDSVLDALSALDRGEIDAVVYDEPLLRYVRAENALSGVEVLPATFEPQPYGFAIPESSVLLEELNRAILRITAGDTWKALRDAQLGG